MLPQEGTAGGLQSRELLTHHIGVRVVNERLLQPVVEDYGHRVRQVAGVTDAGQEAPGTPREQLVDRPCGEQAPVRTPYHRPSVWVLHLRLRASSEKVFIHYHF